MRKRKPYVVLQYGNHSGTVNGKESFSSTGWFWIRFAANHRPVKDGNQTFDRKYNAIRSIVANNPDILQENVFVIDPVVNRSKRQRVKSVLIERSLYTEK